MIAVKTENTKRTDKTQEFDDYEKQEADAREKKAIVDFEKPIINQHYTGLSKTVRTAVATLIICITLYKTSWFTLENELLSYSLDFLDFKLLTFNFFR